MRPWRPLFLTLSLAQATSSQQPCVYRPGGQDSKLWVFNTRFGGLVEYPNFRSATGNIDGDAFWKVIPSELFRRTNRLCQVSHTTFVVNMDNPGAGAGIFLYRAEVRFAARNAQGHLVPDFARGFVAGTPVPETAGVRAAGNYMYRQGGTQRLVNTFDPDSELGIAFVLYAPPGQTPLSPNVQRGVMSGGERYGNSPQPSFSGVRDGRTGQLSLLVPPLVQQAGEFMFAVGFEEAMVTVSATSAGGGNEPWEMNTGIGAYYNDLASRGGRMRLYVEEDALSAGAPNGQRSVYAVPLLSLGRSQATYRLPGMNCDIAIDAGAPLSVLPLLWGWAPNFFVRDAYTNLADAYAWTEWIDIPQSLDLLGVRLHFETLIVIPTRFSPVYSASSSLEIFLR